MTSNSNPVSVSPPIAACIDCGGQPEPLVDHSGFSKRCAPCWDALRTNQCLDCSGPTKRTRTGFAVRCERCYERAMQELAARPDPDEPEPCSGHCSPYSGCMCQVIDLMLGDREGA